MVKVSVTRADGTTIEIEAESAELRELLPEIIHIAETSGGRPPHEPEHGNDGASASGQATATGRNRNPAKVRELREWARERVRRVAGNLEADSRTSFTAAGSHGALVIATTVSGPNDEYWLGIPERTLTRGTPTFIVLALADEAGEPFAFVIPYEQHKPLFDGLSTDSNGERKLTVAQDDGSFFLKGKGVDPPLRVDPYLNAFELFQQS